MPARTPTAFNLDSLKTDLPKIFDQAQNTVANHQKNFIALQKLQSDAANVRTPVQNGKSNKLVGEKAFETEFFDMVMRMLPVKKGAVVADRTVRFMSGYTQFITEKNAELKRQGEVDEDEETTTERFLCRLVAFLLQGATAKDKAVRFRVLQCIADIVPHLGSLDEDLYTKLRTTLFERIRDKEPLVRAQAAIALGKLSYTEDLDDVAEDEPTMEEAFLDAMAYDTSTEVRRAALATVRLSPATLPNVLARTRDVDATIRKMVYKDVLEKFCLPLSESKSGTTIGFTHPRAMSIAQRELVVRNGLGDREPSVKAAAAQLLGAWADVVGPDRSPKEEEEGDAIVKKEAHVVVIDKLVAFLNLFDLAETQVAEDALSSVFDTRVELFDSVELKEDYWRSITAERAFLARVYIEKCNAKKLTSRVDDMLPPTMELALRVQEAYNVLTRQIEADALQDEDEDMRLRQEEARLELEHTVGEMLRICLYLDFGDELGRRRLLQIVRDMITHTEVPESLLPRALDVVRVVSSGEQDLIRMVVEIVHELRDPLEEEGEVKGEGSGDADESMTDIGSPRKQRSHLSKPAGEMTPEEREKADTVDIKCLTICIGLLERVNGTYEQNLTLEGVLNELIVPSVKRRDLLLREKGLVALGLCCLIAQRMALSSFQLFLGQVASSEGIKLRVLQIIFDILMVHEKAFFDPQSPNREQIIMFLINLLQSEDVDSVHALLCVGIAKLMLAGIVADERLLQSLVIIYISPETAGNQELRQCLAYFLPVYCYSSAENQKRMRQIFIPLYEQFVKAYHDWDGEDDMITPAQVTLMFVDWTDPIRASEAVKDPTKDPIHLDLATDVVKALFSDHDKDDKKALYQMLGKLSLPDEVDDDKVRILKLLVVNLRARRPPRDAVTKNALNRFENALSKRYAKQLENFSEDEYRKLEELKDLFEFLDDIIPLDDEEEEEVPKKGRKRRSMSVATETTTSVATSRDGSPPSVHVKSKAKRRRLSQSDDESDTSPATTPAPTRALPRRNAAEQSKKATTKAFDPITISSDDEDEDEDDGDEDDNESTPLAKPRTKRKPPPATRANGKRAPPARSSRARQEAEIDDDIDDMLEGNVTKDSIMDSSEEEEDEEVNNLL